jgi:hypothetical protein
MPTHVLAVIPNRLTHQVLARPGVEGGWMLPEARLDGRHWHGEPQVLTEALARTLELPADIEVRLLRRLAEREHPSEDPAAFLRELIFVAELAPHPAGAAPFESGSDIAIVVEVPGWAWIDAEAAASAAADWVAPVLRNWIAAGRSPVPPERPPWAREGSDWHDRARAWVDGALAGAGRRRTGSLQVIKGWSLAYVMRVPAEPEDVFFKAAARLPLFVDEGPVTADIAERFPAASARVLAVHPREGWLLTADEGLPIRDRSDLEPARRRDLALDVARAHARLQIASIDQSEALLAVGCVDRRPARLAAMIDPLVDSPLTTAALSASELDRLRAARPVLRSALGAYVDLGVPDTLLHGDLHLGNTILREWPDGPRPAFIDWTDAGVGPPFVDLIAPLWEKDPELRAAWEAAYLETWSERLPGPVLDAAWHLNALLRPLHHAASYLAIMESIERLEGDDMASMLPLFLRMLLEAVEKADR